MTPHGAYSELLKAIHRVRDLTRDAQNNVEALYGTGQAPQDPALIDRMVELTKVYRGLESTLANGKRASFEIASEHVEANRDKIKKPRALRA